MTATEIMRMGDPYFALLCATVERARADIRNFERMYTRYNALPELNESRRLSLKQAARWSRSAKMFLSDIGL